MKYVLEYQIRTAGLTHEQMLAAAETSIKTFGKWEPEEALTVHSFVGDLSGTHGYALVETADPVVVMSLVSKFMPWADYEVIPVVDVAEAIATINESQAWVRSALSR